MRQILKTKFTPGEEIVFLYSLLHGAPCFGFASPEFKVRILNRIAKLEKGDDDL